MSDSNKRFGNRRSVMSGQSISRRRFLRTAGVAAAGVGAAAIGLGGTARAVNPPVGPGEPNPDPMNIITDNNGGWIVYPTGEAQNIGENPYVPGFPMTRDSRNVQWAVANVDTDNVNQPQVLLKSSAKGTNQPMYFNFLKDSAVLNPIIYNPQPPLLPIKPVPPATAARVSILNNVAIVGEPMQLGSQWPFPEIEKPQEGFEPDRTMIYGGNTTFFSDYPYLVPPDQLGENDHRASKLAVRNIYFAYPSNSAVRVKYCSGFEVSDCVIYDLFGSDAAYLLRELAPNFYAYVPFRIALAIELTALFLPGAAPFMDPNPYLYGECRITNNVIKRRTEANPNFYGFVDVGIVPQWTDMDTIISGNEIHNFAYIGIALDAVTRSTVMKHNKIYSCGYGGVYHPYLPFPVYESGAIGGRRNISPLDIDSNLIECGYDYGDSKKTEVGIILGGTSNATIRNNTVTGITEQGEAGVSKSGISIVPFSGLYSTDNHVQRNDLKGLLSEQTQINIAAGCDGNICKNNDYGAVSGPDAFRGAFVASNENVFVNENFFGNYPGYPQAVCMWFDSKAKDNTVTALKLGHALQGFDICSQIYFAEGAEPPANTVNGYAKCSAAPQNVKDAMAAKQAAFIARAKKRCTDAGGAWDETTQMCTYPEYP